MNFDNENKIALKCKGLTPGPRSDVGHWTGAMSGEVFYGRLICRSEGIRTVEGIVGRRTDGSFDFSLEPPSMDRIPYFS